VVARVQSLLSPGFRLALLVLLCAGAFAAQAPKRELRVVPVADGVYAVLQPADLRFDDSNSAVIVTSEGVLVVDTQDSPATARLVIAEIRKLTSQPVRWVVNTHWHGDHVNGNRAYREAFSGVEFLAHVHAREDVEARAIPELKGELENLPGEIDAAEKQLAGGIRRDGQPFTDEQKIVQRSRIDRARIRLEGLRQVGEVVPPDVVFEGSVTLHRGREIRLLHFAGHTRGDLVVYLPREKVLITGDLLDDMPFTGHGSPAGLVKTLRALDGLEFDAVIPGHGRVRRGAEAREHLRAVAETFDSLATQVRQCVGQGLSLEDTRKKVDVSAFRERVTGGDPLTVRHWNGFIPEGIARAFEEAGGKVPPK
jgi:cyclase